MKCDTDQLDFSRHCFYSVKPRKTTPVQLQAVERFLGNFLLGSLLKDSDDKSNPEPVPYNTILF